MHTVLSNNCLCVANPYTFVVKCFRATLIGSVALIIIGALGMSSTLPIGIGGVICLSIGAILLTVSTIARIYKMQSEDRNHFSKSYFNGSQLICEHPKPVAFMRQFLCIQSNLSLDNDTNLVSDVNPFGN